MQRLKLTKVGNSVGMILPKEALLQLHVDVGDTLFLTESPAGYRLTPYDPEFDRQLSIARNIMKRRRAALHELAK